MSAQIRIKGVYAITPDQVDTDALILKVRQALSGGINVLQYRNKLANDDLRLSQATALRELTREFNVPFIINDDAQLALNVHADGVHLGNGDSSISAARTLLGSDRIIGVSCYNCLPIAIEAEQQGADYVAFGAFFPSSIKPNAVKATPELLQQARLKLRTPVVAIGGITESNGSALLNSGADALAVISAIFSATNIQLAAQQLSILFPLNPDTH